jgi:hydrogenase/urease accessory protein HupE
MLALLAGLGVIALGAVPPFAGEALLLVAMVTGLLVAWGRPLPETAGLVIAAITGFAVGLDSPPEVVSVREANLMLLGTGFGATVLLVAAVEAGSRLKNAWQRVAARVLGSWIAAIALLVLAVQMAR